MPRGTLASPVRSRSLKKILLCNGVLYLSILGQEKAGAKFEFERKKVRRGRRRIFFSNGGKRREHPSCKVIVIPVFS